MRSALLLVTCLGAAPAAAKPGFTLLHGFMTTDGGDPTCRLVQAADGVLYGTTFVGGQSNAGTVFSLTPPAAGQTGWAFQSIWQFSGGDGVQPAKGVVLDGAGKLYGATTMGCARGMGAIYRLSPPKPGQSAWTRSVLWSFAGGEADGQLPTGGLLGRVASCTEPPRSAAPMARARYSA